MKHLNTLLPYFQSRFRWGAQTIIWTVIAAVLLLSPGGNGSIVVRVSQIAGGTEITDRIGHTLINAILALFWCWTISQYTSPTKTFLLIFICGVIWCFVSECLQFVLPKRGADLLDLMANILGVWIGLTAYKLTALYNR